MTTDEWIAMLARGRDVEAEVHPARRLFVALMTGTLVATVLLVVLLGVRPTLARDMGAPMFWLKGLFCALLAAAGVFAVVRAGRPGARLGAPLAALAAPLVAMWLLAAAVLWLAPSSARPALLIGHSWAECPINIALLSAPVFVAMLWAMRGLAPTRLRLAGAMAGLAAGGVGALVYTLHCDELAAPFLATWYVVAMLVPTLIGAWLGPRVLRW